DIGSPQSDRRKVLKVNREEIEKIIGETYTHIDSAKKFDHFDSEQVDAVKAAIRLLDKGEVRICTKENGQWVTHQWLKQAILLYFKLKKMKVMEIGDLRFVDKIPLKKWEGHEGVRVVPHALVRKGAYIAPGAVLMPSYVNIGAYVGPGTMIDTWATVGSC